MRSSYELEEQKRRSRRSTVEDNKADIGWGSQIRSYVLDRSREGFRTNLKTAQAILDGHLDDSQESLKQGL